MPFFERTKLTKAKKKTTYRSGHLKAEVSENHEVGWPTLTREGHGMQHESYAARKDQTCNDGC